jgi:hypothetical protein
VFGAPSRLSTVVEPCGGLRLVSELKELVVALVKRGVSPHWFYGMGGRLTLPRGSTSRPHRRALPYRFASALTAVAACLLTTSASAAPPASPTPTPSPTQTPSCANNNISVTRTSASAVYIDTGLSTPITNAYASYEIQNNTGSTISDLWVKIGNFAGPNIGLGTYSLDTHHVGALASGASTTVYFYLKASAATASNETHSIVLYDGNPSVVSSTCSNVFSLAASETIKAAANKVTYVVNGPNPPEVGGVVTLTTDGETGQNTGPMAISPASLDSWRADVFQLTGVTTTFSSGGVSQGSFSDALQLTIPSTSNLTYSAVYTFKVTSITNTATTVYPVNNISSGGQMKHTDTTSFAFDPVQAPQNFLRISLACLPV